MNLPHLCLAEFHRDFRQKNQSPQVIVWHCLHDSRFSHLCSRGEIKLWGEADLIS